MERPDLQGLMVPAGNLEQQGRKELVGILDILVQPVREVYRVKLGLQE